MRQRFGHQNEPIRGKGTGTAAVLRSTAHSHRQCGDAHPHSRASVEDCRARCRPQLTCRMIASRRGELVGGLRSRAAKASAPTGLRSAPSSLPELSPDTTICGGDKKSGWGEHALLAGVSLSPCSHDIRPFSLHPFSTVLEEESC
eukprot:5846090-Pleurochrysis_carterae.AAC.1